MAKYDSRLIMRIRILIVPGLNGSGPGHWQTLWEEKYGCGRVEQRDWENPDIAEWVGTLNAAITAGAGRTIIVAHSLGCLGIPLAIVPL
jgi:predicted alpha/beta hydrolase family esterase